MTEKICILGYDGLDIGRVNEFDLQNLKQREYGTTDISEFELKSTPILWSSFFTGMNTQDVFFETGPKQRRLWKRAKGIYEKSVSRLPDTLSQRITLTLKRRVRGIRTKSLDKENPGEFGDTIFKHFDDPYVSDVPAFNHSPVDRPELDEVVKGKVDTEEFVNSVMQGFRDRKKALLGALDSHDFLMPYFDCADLIGHVAFGDKSLMKRVYTELDTLTREVQEQFDGWVLVVSDHGMESLGRFGDHSNVMYGFYSSNRALGLNQPKISEFYNLIIGEKTYNKEIDGRNDEAEILEKLEDLGYL